MVSGIIVAAGKGTRMGAAVNKVLLKIFGKSIIEYTIEAFENCVDTDEIILVIGKDDEAEFCEILKKYPNVKYVFGGKTRRESVLNGLKAAESDYVAVHDGARALITPELISKVIADGKKYGAATLGVKAKDTVKLIDENGFVVHTTDRNSTYQTQTPQVFKKSLIISAHEQVNDDATDDAALAEKMGIKVKMTDGCYENIKITTPEDLISAKEILKEREGTKVNDLRIGYGFDVHKLTEGRKLILCGTEIPHSFGLLGHSDADVAVHALCDAILGAAALGDIGRHFPDTDMKYKGINSMLLLAEVIKKTEELNYEINNADITIVAQKPKLMGYIETMRKNIAETLKTEVGNVNIKATTTEKLGFEGREEGISATAAVTLRGRKG